MTSVSPIAVINGLPILPPEALAAAVAVLAVLLLLALIAMMRGGSARRREGDYRLKQDVRVDAAFGKAELSLPDFLKKELVDRILTAHARLIVGNGIGGEQVREVVPQTEFDIMSVGILHALDGADGLDAFNVGFKAFDPCFEGRQRIRLLSGGQDTPCADREGDDHDGLRGHRQDSTTWCRT